MNTPIFLYEGDDSYIFVSYCHKDKERVYPVISELYSRGCRIWYDDGIDPGTEWPEVIAQHLGIGCGTAHSVSVRITEAPDNIYHYLNKYVFKHLIKIYIGFIKLRYCVTNQISYLLITYKSAFGGHKTLLNSLKL